MSKQNRVLGITLARGGSKGVPGKNIRPLAGHPLIAYTIAEALRTKCLTRYIVSTDSESIKEVAETYGAEVPFLRPSEFSGDTATSAAALQHAVSWCEEQEGQSYDYIVEMMCTNPFKLSSDITAVVEKLIDTGADSVIGVVQLEEHHPARIKKIVNDKIVDFCVPELSSRRQDLRPFAYLRNGSIYAMRRDSLMVDGHRFGSENSRPYVMPPERSINIDSEIDLIVAQELLRREPRPYVSEAP